MKKQTVSGKILNLLNTMGGFKPKDIIKATKLKPASVYTTLNVLRNQGKIAKEEDGFYISQTQTATTPTKVLTPVNKKPRKVRSKPTEVIKQMEVDMHEMQKLAMYWKDAYTKLEAEHRGTNAVIRYLESKIAQLLA